MICASIDVIVQAARLRDGSRRITHITEVMGMEGDVIITQDLFLYDMIGEDANGRHHRASPLDRHRPAAVLGSRPLFRRGEAPRRGARRGRSRRERSKLIGFMPMQTLGCSSWPRPLASAACLGVPLSDPVGRRRPSGAASVDRAPSRRRRQADRRTARSRREQVEDR